MKKENSEVVNRLREQWKKACNDYLVELAHMWDWDVSGDAQYGFWIGDDIGGVYSYGETAFISMDDIIYCVENKVPYAEYRCWSEYNIDAHEFGFDQINLKSWCNGCPRTPREVFDKLRAMKHGLEKEIEKEKERLKNGDYNPF